MTSTKSERNIILLFTGPLSSMLIDSINLESGEKKQFRVKCDSARQLLDVLGSMINFKGIKAFIFCSMDSKSVPFSKGYEFRISCHIFCQENGIYCIFTEEFLLNALAGIMHTKTAVKEGEEILFVSTGVAVDTFEIAKIVRQNGNYHIYDTINSTRFTPKFLQDEFLKNFHFQKVILLHNSINNNTTFTKSINKCFKKCNPVILFQGPKKELLQDAAVAKVLHLMGEKINPYEIATHCTIPYKVYCGKKFLFEFKEFDLVPAEKSVILEAGIEKEIMIHPPGGLASLQCIPMPPHFKSKRIKASFTVDVSSCYGLHWNFINDKNDTDKKLPKLKNGDIPEKVQLLFDKRHFSVTVFANGNKEYKIKDVDGLEKTPIYLSFTRRQPLIGKSAVEMYDEKPEFVVYDLIKLCSTTNADIINPKWGFKLEKEEDGSLMVTMDTVNGGRRSKIEFLMALILRNAIKRIFKEIGKRMEELEIGFDGFAPNEILKKNFVEAGNLMKCKIVFI